MGKGEVDCQPQHGWRMTAVRAGVNMTASRRVQDDRQQGIRMTAGRVGVSMTASRKGRG